MTSANRDHRFPSTLYAMWDALMPGLEGGHGKAHYIEVFQRVLTFNNLLASHRIQPRGVVYLGANEGQLIWVWLLMGFRNLLLVEPQERAFSRLERYADACSRLLLSLETFTDAAQPTRLHLARCLVGEFDGEADLFITTNSNLTSMLEPHADSGDSAAYQEALALKDTVKVPILTADSLVAQLGDDTTYEDFNMLYMNLQGAELKALEGAPRLLRAMEYVYLENNYVSRYSGCPTAEELDAFLLAHDFVPAWGMKNERVGNGFTGYVKRHLAGG